MYIRTVCSKHTGTTYITYYKHEGGRERDRERERGLKTDTSLYRPSTDGLIYRGRYLLVLGGSPCPIVILRVLPEGLMNATSP